MSGAIAVQRPPQALRLRRESQRPGVARSATKQSTMEDESPKHDTRRYGASKKTQRSAAQSTTAHFDIAPG